MGEEETRPERDFFSGVYELSMVLNGTPIGGSLTS